MTMIPGAMEPRRPSSSAGSPAEIVYARVAGGGPSEAKGRRAELPGWLKVSIFAAVLIAVMWLVMSVF